MASPGGYGSLISAGTGVITSFMQASSLADAAYNRAYAAAVAQSNARNKMHEGELSISAAKQKSINVRTIVGMWQDEAEANIRVAAAAAGVSGDSVDATIYQTEVNEALKTQSRKIAEDNEIASAQSMVYGGYQGAQIPSDNYDVSAVGTVAAGLGSISQDMWTDIGLQLEQPEYKMGTSKSEVGQHGTQGLGGR